MFHRLSAAFFLTLLCFSSAHAKDPATAEKPEDRFEKRTFKGKVEGKLLYRLCKPGEDAAGKSKKPPLLIFLHGAGERGDDNERQLIWGKAFMLAAVDQHGAVVIAPQCPKEKRWVEVDWSAKEHDMPDKPSETAALLEELLPKLIKEFDIDESRIYVTGLSMGGYGTWDMAQRHPDMIAAAAPICGGGDAKQARRLKDVPIWAFHGDADRAVPVERSRKMIAAIKEAGGEPKYTEYEGVGHNSWSPAYGNPELLKWMFEQKLEKK